MSRRREIDVRAHAAAPPSVVFALLADGASWPSWSPIEAFELERPGDPAPEGPGAIRRFTRGRTLGRDELLEVTPDRRLRYASLSGLPVRDYTASVELTPAAGGGTGIRWRASFEAQRPGTGWVLEKGIARFLGQCASGLAERAGSRSAAPAAA